MPYFYDRINTIYQFSKSFLDKKCLFLRDMAPLTVPVSTQHPQTPTTECRINYPSLPMYRAMEIPRPTCPDCPISLRISTKFQFICPWTTTS